MRDFLDKLEAERAILRLINRAFAQPELSGLSEVAIKEWTRGASRMSIEPLLTHASSVLLTVAQRSAERRGLEPTALDETLPAILADIERALPDARCA